MTLLAKVGTFTLNSGTGNQSITGVGFLPKIIIFSGSLGSSGANWVQTFGVAASSTARWASANRSNNGAGTTECDRSFETTACLLYTDGLGHNYIVADFVSQDADGFTINISLRGSGTRVVQYLALGGTDIDVKVGTFNSPGTTGNQSITGVGFQPGLVIINNTLSNTTVGAASNNLSMLGAAKSSTARWVTYAIDLDAQATAAADRYYNTDRCLVRSDGTLTVNNSADFVSQDADGFTVNHTAASGAIIYGYIALGGSAQFAVSSFVSATATGNQSVTGLGFQPTCEMFFSNGHTATGFTTDAKMQIGMAVSSTNRGVVSYNSTDGVGTSETSYYQDTANCIRHISGGTPTNDAVADFVSQDADGFTINWGTADASARTNLFIAIGAASAGGFKPFWATKRSHMIGNR